MSVVRLRSVGSHVVLGFPDLAHQAQRGQTGLLTRLPNSCVLRRFAGLDCPRRDLQARFVLRLVEVPEDEQLSVPDDVADDFLLYRECRHQGSLGDLRDA